jgi:hypothetical protein
LLGAWGLDYLAEGDVMFPLRMGELQLLGDRPAVGTEVNCQIAIHELERHRIRVDAQFVRPDGTIWMLIKDWEDWRFHWPGRYRDSFRQPRDYLVGEELPLEDSPGRAVAGARAVWLEPPADMGRPVWRDVLEFTQLGPEERAHLLATVASEDDRSHRLWGQIAAKEAARRLWNDAGGLAIYPADLTIIEDANRRPRLERIGRPGSDPTPAIAVAHADGVAVALAVLGPATSAGIAVEPITDGSDSLLALAFTAEELVLLEDWSGPSRAEWMTRFSCAKQAATRAAGLDLAAGSAGAQVVEVDEASEALYVRLAVDRSTECPEIRAELPLRVLSARRGRRVWAWTIAKGTKP